MGKNEVLKVLNIARQDTVLNLSDSGLKALPPEVGLLKNLRKLILDNNQLRELPAEIAGLTELEELSLNGNKLISIPADIAKLRKLRHLELENNRLVELPEELKELPDLRILKIAGNSLPIPPESLASSCRELIDYVLQHQETRHINEVKLMVLGMPGAGKSTLVQRLIGGSYADEKGVSKGVSVQRWPIRIDEKRVQVNSWDFGPEELEKGLYKCFLSRRALYLICLDASGENLHREAERFLEAIQSYAGTVPVVIVLNKTDISSGEIDRQQLRERYPIIQGFVNLSTRENVGVNDLREALRRLVAQMAFLRIKWPPGCLNVKTRLEIKKAEFLSNREFEILCESENVEPATRPVLLEYLHDLGVITNYHREFGLRDFYIRNPGWLTSVLRQLLGRHGESSEGLLHATDLDKFLDSASFPPSRKQFILNLMNHFELCMPVSSGADPSFLVPGWIPPEADIVSGGMDDALGFEYHYARLPENIFAKFIIHTLPLFPDRQFWRTGMLFSNGANRAFVRLDETRRRITMRIFGRKNTRRDFLAQLRYTFERIHKGYADITVVERLPLAGSKQTVDYTHLLKLEERGIVEFLPEGGEELVRVASLLNGYERTAAAPAGDPLAAAVKVIPETDEGSPQGKTPLRKNGFHPSATELPDAPARPAAAEESEPAAEPPTVIEFSDEMEPKKQVETATDRPIAGPRPLPVEAVSRTSVLPVALKTVEESRAQAVSMLRKQLTVLNEKIEDLWQTYSREEDRNGLLELEQQIQVAETDRDTILGRLEDYKNNTSAG